MSSPHSFFKRGIFFIAGIFLAGVLISGCWDYRDIDRRIFVGGVGIDKSEQPGRYTISFMMPIVRAIAGGEGGSGGGGGDARPIVTKSTTADSVTDGARNTALRANRDLFFEHMRIVVIGEDVAREGLEPVINPFMRQTEFNRRSRIAIAEGKAKDVTEVQSVVEKLPTAYLESLYSNISLSGKFIDGDLGDFLHQIHAFKGNAIVSRIKASPASNEANIGGGAVVKHFKLAGWLSEEETQGVNFFMGKIFGGNITIDDPEVKGKCTFVILTACRQLQLIAEGPVPELALKVNVQGNISETTEGVILDIRDEKEIERLVSEKIKSQILHGMAKLQENYKVDVVGLGDYLHKYHPKLWREYEHRWEKIFPDVRISVDVSARIENIGVTR